MEPANTIHAVFISFFNSFGLDMSIPFAIAIHFSVTIHNQQDFIETLCIKLIFPD